ncbi:MAG TPA: hypothetical protein DEA96_07605 [Leptospiraceae bacterium]|nr:hypothetical protein [Spirochaetaceae bacterium]HBS04811.1 hypothetical protein [Leptospiraceae bacterium]|tara:strand:- start:57520 stop:58470 length:951 start_codon:yes stop_codon:yes gene_type:complete
MGFRWLRFFRRGHTALCLNSSYFGFYAHAGFLQGLKELQLHPEHVSGASAGAIVAGLYAAGMQPEEIAKEFLNPRLSRVFMEWQASYRMPALMLNRKGVTGAFDGRKVQALLKEFIGDRRIEDCEHPTLALSVANLTAGRTETARNGLIREYIMASCAMPGLFQAQKINGDLYWDGGIADPIPFEHWLENDRIRRIIVHQVIPIATGRKKYRKDEYLRGRSDSAPRQVPDNQLVYRSGSDESPEKFSFLSALERSHEIISDELIRLRLEMARSRGVKVLWFRTETPRLGPHKMHRGGINFELGRKVALDNASVIKP